MVPGPIGSANHLVHESLVVHDIANDGFPSHGDSLPLESVPNAGALPYLRVGAGTHGEAKPGRCDRFEVVGILEEPEYRDQVGGNELSSLEVM
jgi:hypothetical protein